MTNINPLQTNYYNFSISKGDENIKLFCQSIALPGIQLNTQQQPTILGTQIPVAVNTFSFEPLKVEFIVDENLENWKSIFDWMKQIGNIEDDISNIPYQQWSADASLTILQSNYYPNMNISFYYVIPVSLSALNFRSDASDSTPIKSIATFSYSHYMFV
jgi:hypothetical protein